MTREGAVFDAEVEVFASTGAVDGVISTTFVDIDFSGGTAAIATVFAAVAAVAFSISVSMGSVVADAEVSPMAGSGSLTVSTVADCC